MNRSFVLCLIAVLCIIGFGCGGAGSSGGDLERLTPIVQRLQSPDLDEREAANDELEALAAEGISAGESRALLRMATQEFPPLEYEWMDSCSQLIRAAATHPHDGLIPLIQEHFTDYTPLGKTEALRQLAFFPDERAVTAFAELVSEEREELEYLPTGSLSTKPRFCETLIPSLLPHLGHEGIRWGISEICLACLQKERLPPVVVDQAAKAYVRLARNYRELLLPLQQTDGSAWIWEDDYQEIRDIAALIFDVLGHLEGPDVIEELSKAQLLSDPRLEMFAVLGSLRNGQKVDGQVVNTIAASAEARNWFFRGLTDIGRVDLFPSQFFSTEAFAESDMVNWLAYPTELARTPDEIELMKVVSFEFADGIGDYFLFRFRTFSPHWAADDGWLAGVAGPFMQSNGPSPESHGDTFSSFEPWDSKSPEEHAQEIIDLLEESREMRNEE